MTCVNQGAILRGNSLVLNFVGQLSKVNRAHFISSPRHTHDLAGVLHNVLAGVYELAHSVSTRVPRMFSFESISQILAQGLL